MTLVEVQIDRLVGPTHHFGGLGVGNVASQQHAGQVSNPAAAALQGLDKMRLVAGYGVPQLVLPPQPRPDYAFLRSLGFGGSDADVLCRAREEAPALLSAATSCSAMWTANAATVTPGADSGRQETNITIANLDASVHRAIEPMATWKDLQRALPVGCHFHAPLPGGAATRDEGAANHIRLGTGQNSAGINLLVYGDGDPRPQHRWPRQSLAACRAIARLHALPEENTFFLKQHPDAIDAGAFHNDVVAMSHQNLLIYHELAFLENETTFQRLDERFSDLTGSQLQRIVVPNSSIPLIDAVETYLFNSQIVSPFNRDASPPLIICTAQVQRHPAAYNLVEQWCQSGLFERAEYVDLDQSMSGGGGPACLRLRVPLTQQDRRSMPASSLWCESLDEQLRDVIHQWYVTELTIDDLANTDFHNHARQAYEQIVNLL